MFRGPIWSDNRAWILHGSRLKRPSSGWWDVHNIAWWSLCWSLLCWHQDSFQKHFFGSLSSVECLETLFRFGVWHLVRVPEDYSQEFDIRYSVQKHYFKEQQHLVNASCSRGWFHFRCRVAVFMNVTLLAGGSPDVFYQCSETLIKPAAMQWHGYYVNCADLHMILNNRSGAWIPTSFRMKVWEGEL